MLFFSKPLALTMFKDGLASKLAVSHYVSPNLLQPFRGFHQPSSWLWQQRNGSYMKYASYRSPSSLPSAQSPSPSGLSSNSLPPSGSSKSSPDFPPPSSCPGPRSESSPAPLSLNQRCSPSPKMLEGMQPKDVRSCLKLSSNAGTSNVHRSMSTYRPMSQGMLRPPTLAEKMCSRSLHVSCPRPRKSSSDYGRDCKPTREICKEKKEVCVDTTSCHDKDAECYPKKIKCDSRQVKKKEVVEEKEVCPKSCVKGGKCIIAPSKKPAKMVYGPSVCPPPKLISPRTCPKTSTNESPHEEPICTEKVTVKKLRKDICVPPPLPGPPTDPVPLCPCPPPPKLHPGPCPCPIFREEVAIKPAPTCPMKDKYPCCLPVYYCPPKRPCKRELPCEKKEKEKEKKTKK